MLANKHIQEFQRLYKEHFGEEISRKEAHENGMQLVRLMQLIYQPMTETELQELQKRRKETSGK